MKQLVAIAIIASVTATPPQAGTPIKGFERFQEWSGLVWAHTPGELDDAVRAIELWTPADLSAARVDLAAVVAVISGSAGSSAVVQYTSDGRILRPTEMARPTSRPRTIRAEDVPSLIALRGARPRGFFDEAEVTRFMKRAAILHTDVVMLSRTPAGAAAPPRGADMAATTRRVVDGQDTGWDSRPIHWEFGRTALDGVRPAAGADPLVAAWYRATSAYLQFRREYGFLVPHLTKARTILPKDPYLQLYSGVLHEAYAAPSVQAALPALSTRAFRPHVESPAEELKLAELFYRRALELDPGLAIARMRLGRVIGLLGRHPQAVAELRQALLTLTGDRHRYYGELFLGAEQQAVGRAADAKAAFQRAQALFPNAQSPYLALGQLAWQRADRTGADVVLERLMAAPSEQGSREDPWWTYELSAVLDVAILVDQLRHIVAEHVQK